MDLPPSHRAAEIFEAALSRDIASRQSFVAERCGSDGTLLAEVKELLASHEAMPSQFLSSRGGLDIDLDATAWQPPTPAALAQVESEQAGEMIGPYKLREQIGEGGFGTVWVAAQDKPVRRRVALKIVKLGMDTKQVIARFEQERQALAMMDHPNIARVLDAGATQQGRPYFVMELVRGLKITEYCDHNQLTTDKRLELFAQVCHAVQHAHQKGIIHRDIKPSNVMITLHDGVPVPKVIDFGIAKATEGRLSDATIYTRLHEFVGTPAYMSPEQAEMSGLDVDTRSDIYSLGVLLYELLAGSTPFDANELMSLGIDAMRKTIREQDPVRPSTRLAALKEADQTSTAKRRSSDKAKLFHQLKGDLDWIVMKCIEKDRTRRYETANGLAADIRRYLVNEPVTARPPSARYHLQKVWRRNKVACTAGSIVVIAVIVGLVASVLALVGQRRAATAERAASEMRRAVDLSRTRAESTAAVIEGMLDDVVPDLLEQGNRTGIRTVMDSADRMLSRHLNESPIAEFTVRRALARQLQTVDLFELDEALEQIHRMEELLPRLTEEDLSFSDRRAFLAWAAGMRAVNDDFEGGTRALRSLRSQMEGDVPRPTSLIIETLIMESDANVIAGNFSEAERLIREAYALDPASPGQYNLTQESPVARYANVLLMQGKYVEALPHARRSLDLFWAESRPRKSLIYADRVIDALCGAQRLVEAEGVIRNLESSLKSRDQPNGRPLQFLTAQVLIAQGRWKDVEELLIENGLRNDATSESWRLGALAAAAHADSKTYLKFVQKGYEYLSTADTQSAYWLYETLTLRPQTPELEEVTNAIRERLRKASYGWWTSLALMGDARRSIYSGNFEEALQTIDQFTQTRNLHGVASLILRQVLDEQRHQYTRAVALAELDRMDEAREAFLVAWNRTKAGPPVGFSARAIIGKYLSERSLRHWAAGILTARGIELPSEAIIR